MASAVLSSIHQIFDDHHHSSSNGGGGGGEINRQEVQAAIAKAVELRALHAALTQGTTTTTSSPSSAAAANLRYLPPPSSSPASSRPLPQFSAQDYPVFTPSYEDEPFPGIQYSMPAKSRTASESWDECGVEGGGGTMSYETVLSDFKKEKGIHSADDQKSVTGPCINNITVLHSSPGGGVTTTTTAAELYKSSRGLNFADFKSSSSCNNRSRAMADFEAQNRKSKIHSNIVVPLTDSHASVQSQPRSKGMMSWLFPRLRKKPTKNAATTSPVRAESEEASQAFGELGLLSIENLRRELRESNETRDAALTEVAETRASLGPLRQKIEHLEGYCEELKKALKSATRSKGRAKSIDGYAQNNNNSNLHPSILPVTDEAMVEGFLQMVAESRLSVKQFCKALISQIEDDTADSPLIETLLSLNSNHPKTILYHLESIINDTMHQDFENSAFHNNGAPKHLDPQQDRQAQFQSFVSLRNLSWNEVLRKGTKYYSEEFSKFCDQRMSCIIAALNWTRPWPEQLLQAFFVAAKCVWLLHLLAFSFDPAIGILRVEEERGFDPRYMEEVSRERAGNGGGGGSSKVVKVMVMPGFYVQGRVLRCKVLCRYKGSYGHSRGVNVSS
ncbi:unnamed protein product [Linum tenue]|uniref:GIL1/IRKI C-terminal domain-containing protein n=1 Tax=Linum tenue TaxID=586396 RepID=A0AAV0JVN0_9ROSI|nr:unnamed protein product [Linum tenue]